MNILIIGGAGFIGSYLVDYHRKLGDDVIVIDNLSTGSKKNVAPYLDDSHFHLIQNDFLLLLDHDLDLITTKCDMIYDLAAVVGMYRVIKHPIETLRINIGITEKLLASVVRVNKKPRIIIASSSEVYGSNSEAMKETDMILIESSSKAHASYLISKLCNEITGISYWKENQLPVTVARIFNTVGNKQSSHYGMVVPFFAEKALRNEPITVFSTGLQTRSFCDVRDLCRMFYKLMTTEKSIGEIINVGSDQSISILDLAKKIVAITESSSVINFKDYEAAYGKEYIAIEHRKPNLDKLKKIIDYGHCYNLDDTIRSMINNITI